MDRVAGIDPAHEAIKRYLGFFEGKSRSRINQHRVREIDLPGVYGTDNQSYSKTLGFRWNDFG